MEVAGITSSIVVVKRNIQLPQDLMQMSPPPEALVCTVLHQKTKSTLIEDTYFGMRTLTLINVAPNTVVKFFGTYIA